MPRRSLSWLPGVGSSVTAGVSGPSLHRFGLASSGGQAEVLLGDSLISPEPMGREGRRAARASARVDWFELLVLVAFAAVSMWSVAVNLHYAHMSGLVWTGIDGEFPGDQLQYLAWIRDASHHVLVSDLFVPWPTPHDYLQPMVAISGGFVALGMAPWLALLLWKPVALLALFFTVRAYCRRMLSGRWERRAALALALFAAAWGALGDEWLPFLSWGYPYALISTGARFVFADCPTDAHLTGWLRPITRAVHRFGCVIVYEVS